MLRYGESVFAKESQGIEFFVIVALDYYIKSGQLLNYLFIDICPRRRLHRMCAFKKRQKLPVACDVFLQIGYTPSDETNGL